MAKEMKGKAASKGQSKFMQWYESYSGKKIVGCVYSLGASIVIIGALFKIMHFPGAGPMLIAGMSVEALLFAIGCLDKPHAEFHWESVFPQLVGHGADPELIKELESRPRPTLLGGVGGGEAGSGASPVSVPADPYDQPLSGLERQSPAAGLCFRGSGCGFPDSVQLLLRRLRGRHGFPADAAGHRSDGRPALHRGPVRKRIPQPVPVRSDLGRHQSVRCRGEAP